MYLQSYALSRFLFRRFGEFIQNDARRVVFRSGMKRFVPHFDIPALILVWDGFDTDEDVGVWSYLPFRISSESGECLVRVSVEFLHDTPTELLATRSPTSRAMVSDLFVFPNLPLPEELAHFIAPLESSTGDTSARFVWSTYQYVSNKFRIEYITKVLDPFAKGFSALDFASSLKGYFPFQRFFLIPIGKVPFPLPSSPDKVVVFDFSASQYFLFRINAIDFGNSIYETAETSGERWLQVTVSAETRQPFLSFFHPNWEAFRRTQ